MRFSHTTIVILVFFIFSFSLIGCSKTGVEDSSSVTTPPASGSGGTGGGTVEDGVFELVLYETPGYLSHTLHKEGAVFTEPCRVSATATGNDRDITCFLEANELDLFTFGMKLQIRASGSTCEHVGFRGYYYYVDDIDLTKIPTDVTVVEVNGGNGAIDYAASSFEDSNGTVTSGAALADYIKPGPEVICPYDYSAYDGPNCCEGSYNYSFTNKSGTQTDTIEDWGGKLSDCLSGAGMELPLTSNGWPREVIYSPTSEVVDDIITEFEPKSPIEAEEPIIYLANYYSGARPAAFDLNFDGAQVYYEDNDYYSWFCYDASQEINARIRLRVREWNTGSSVDPAGDPDVAGNEPPPFGDYLLGDYFDWDNVGTGFPDYYIFGSHW